MCIRKYTCALCTSFHHIIDRNFTQDIYQLMSFFYVLTNSPFFQFQLYFIFQLQLSWTTLLLHVTTTLWLVICYHNTSTAVHPVSAHVSGAWGWNFRSYQEPAHRSCSIVFCHALSPLTRFPVRSAPISAPLWGPTDAKLGHSQFVFYKFVCSQFSVCFYSLCVFNSYF